MLPIPAAIMKAMGHVEMRTMIYVSLGKSHIREQAERLNMILVPSTQEKNARTRSNPPLGTTPPMQRISASPELPPTPPRSLSAPG
jgi:hypothetical protein